MTPPEPVDASTPPDLVPPSQDSHQEQNVGRGEASVAAEFRGHKLKDTKDFRSLRSRPGSSNSNGGPSSARGTSSTPFLKPQQTVAPVEPLWTRQPFSSRKKPFLGAGINKPLNTLSSRAGEVIKRVPAKKNRKSNRHWSCSVVVRPAPSLQVIPALVSTDESGVRVQSESTDMEISHRFHWKDVLFERTAGNPEDTVVLRGPPDNQVTLRTQRNYGESMKDVFVKHGILNDSERAADMDLSRLAAECTREIKERDKAKLTVATESTNELEKSETLKSLEFTAKPSVGCMRYESPEGIRTLRAAIWADSRVLVVCARVIKCLFKWNSITVNPMPSDYDSKRRHFQVTFIEGRHWLKGTIDTVIEGFVLFVPTENADEFQQAAQGSGNTVPLSPSAPPSSPPQPKAKDILTPETRVVPPPIDPSHFYSDPASESTPSRKPHVPRFDSLGGKLPTPKLAKAGRERAVNLDLDSKTGGEPTREERIGIKQSNDQPIDQTIGHVELEGAQGPDDGVNLGSEGNPIVLNASPEKKGAGPASVKKSMRRAACNVDYLELASDDDSDGSGAAGDIPLEPSDEDYSALIQQGYHEMVHEFKDGRKATVGVEELARLNPRVYLDDAILLFFLKLSRDECPQADRVLLLNTFFYTEVLKRQRHKWIVNSPLLESHVVILPVHERIHWTVAVIIGLDWLAKPPNEATGSEPRKPIIVYLDSLDSSSTRRTTVRKVARVVAEVVNAQNELGNHNITLNSRFYQEIRLTVPLQPNLYDCGVYVVHFVQRILNKLDSFLAAVETAQAGEVLAFDGFWQSEDLPGKRDELRALLANLGARSDKAESSEGVNGQKPRICTDRGTGSNTTTPGEGATDSDDGIEVVTVVDQRRKRARVGPKGSPSESVRRRKLRERPSAPSSASQSRAPSAEPDASAPSHSESTPNATETPKLTS